MNGNVNTLTIQSHFPSCLMLCRVLLRNFTRVIIIIVIDSLWRSWNYYWIPFVIIIAYCDIIVSMHTVILSTLCYLHCDILFPCMFPCTFPCTLTVHTDIYYNFHMHYISFPCVYTCSVSLTWWPWALTQTRTSRSRLISTSLITHLDMATWCRYYCYTNQL